MMYHFNASFDYGICKYGYIGVNFFLLVTGFLLEKSSRHINTDDCDYIAETWNFIIRKVSLFYPYYITAILFQLFVRYILILHEDMHQIIGMFVKGIPNFTLTMWGFSTFGNLYVSGNWYLSAMIIACFILYPIALKYKKWATMYAFPILSMFMMGNMYNKMDRFIIDSAASMQYVLFGIIQAISITMFGAFIYNLYETIGLKDYRFWVKCLLTIIKYISYGVVFYFAIVGRSDAGFDIHATLFLAVAVLLSFSNITFSIKNTVITQWLGKFSLPLFIFHPLIRFCAQDLLGKDILLEIKVLLIFLSIFTSFLLMIFTDTMVRILRKVHVFK